MWMVVKAPRMGWTLEDGAHILLFLLLLALVVIIPYGWILPIHYYGAYRRQQGKLFREPTFHWGLRHLWIASSLWFASDVLALLFFDYPSVTAMFLGNSYQEPALPISKRVADLDIFFCAGLLVGSIALLKREDFVGFLQRVRGNAGSIGIGIMLAIGLKFGLGIYVATFQNLGVDFSEGAMITASVTDSILSINKYYNPLLGFLFVAVFAPFYEEILFRGVFLSACQKNMSLMLANVLQASVFALAHQSVVYFPFYLAFGLVAGHYTRKTGSLVTSTSMHMMYNAMAFVYLLSAKG
jgi:membrane protease YdiL (CAAX protease family)